MDIVAVVKDPGGMQAVLPIVEELRNRGRTVTVASNGKASELLIAQGKEHISSTSAAALLEEKSTPRVLLTSMCSGGGVGRDLVPLLRGKATVVAVQDQWGARLKTDWNDPMYRPDYLIVGDEEAKRIVLRAWPDYPMYQVVAFGWAALDPLAYFNQASAQDRVRSRLSICDHQTLFYYSGQVSQGTTRALGELLDAVGQLSPQVKVIAAKHPRMSENPAEAQRWDEVLHTYASTVFDPGDAKFSELEWVAAADATVSMFGTALLIATAMRKPAISIMYPRSPMREGYHKTTGGLMDEHPLVALGAVAGPKEFSHLVTDCEDVLRGGLAHRLQIHQEEHVRVGENASQIASFIAGL